MAKARSPGYPIIGLKEAIEKAGLIYEQDYQNPLSRDLVARHMGYQSLNGKSLGVLASLTKFGLLEGRGNDTRVSDLAVRIIAHPPGTRERAEALQEAASIPDLYVELDGKFQGGRASDQALRSYLLTQKFIPPAADMAIRAYRETKVLVASEASQYDAAPVEEPPVQHQANPEAVRQGTPPPAPAAPHTPAPLDAEPYRVSLTSTGGLEVLARLESVADAEALKEDIEHFIAMMRVREDRAKRRAEAVAALAKHYETGDGGEKD